MITSGSSCTAVTNITTGGPICSITSNDGGGDSGGGDGGNTGGGTGGGGDVYKNVSPVLLGLNAGSNGVVGDNAVVLGTEAAYTGVPGTSIAIGYKAAMDQNGDPNHNGIEGLFLGKQSNGLNPILQRVDPFFLGNNPEQTDVMVYNNVTGRVDRIPTQYFISGDVASNLFVKYADDPIRIGPNAGGPDQTSLGIAIGHTAGVGQARQTVAIGQNAADTNQSEKGIAIGWKAANDTQGEMGVAVGADAGSEKQGQGAVAVGFSAASTEQGDESVAVGYQSAGFKTGYRSVAVGPWCGQRDLPDYSIALGFWAASDVDDNDEPLHGGKRGMYIGRSTLSQDWLIEKYDKADIKQDEGEFLFLENTTGRVYRTSMSDILDDYKIDIDIPQELKSLNPTVIGSQWSVFHPKTVALGFLAGANQSDVGFFVGEDDNGNPVIQNIGTVDETKHEILYIETSKGKILRGPISDLIPEEGNYVTRTDNPVTIGPSAGAIFTDRTDSIAIGNGAGAGNQGVECVAIGKASGSTYQGTRSVSIGSLAGFKSQESYAIAIGYEAGKNGQQPSAIAIGHLAGKADQLENGLPTDTQKEYAVAIGYSAGQTNQAASSVAIGHNAGKTNQEPASVAIGLECGMSEQGQLAVAIGRKCGVTYQGNECVAIGSNTGNQQQKIRSVAIGSNAGYFVQGDYSVCIGYYAGRYSAPKYSVMLGHKAGFLKIPNNTTSYATDTGFYIGNDANDNIIVPTITTLDESTQSHVIIDNTTGQLKKIPVGLDPVIVGSQTETRLFNTEQLRIIETQLNLYDLLDTNQRMETTISIGRNAGTNDMEASSICIGTNAGHGVVGRCSIAIGHGALGSGNGGKNVIAIGTYAAEDGLPEQSIALGKWAGTGTVDNEGNMMFPIQRETGMYIGWRDDNQTESIIEPIRLKEKTIQYKRNLQTLAIEKNTGKIVRISRDGTKSLDELEEEFNDFVTQDQLNELQDKLEDMQKFNQLQMDYNTLLNRVVQLELKLQTLTNC